MNLFESKPNGLEVLNLPEVRISAASFARIKDEQGRLALLINQNRAKKGVFVLTPIGGALEATDDGIEDLKDMLEIESKAFEKGNDLRFKMSGSKANKFREWFLSGKDRETDAAREVVEELVEESNLLSDEDLTHIDCEKASYFTELAETSRAGQEGQMTLRLAEVYDTAIGVETLRKLIDQSQNKDSLIRFVTAQEIRNGETNDGVSIAEISKALINDNQDIKEFV